MANNIAIKLSFLADSGPAVTAAKQVISLIQQVDAAMGRAKNTAKSGAAGGAASTPIQQASGTAAGPGGGAVAATNNAAKAAKQLQQQYNQAAASIKKTFSTISTTLSGVTQSVKKVFDSMRLITQGIGEIGRALAMYIIVPMAALSGMAFKIAVDYEQSFARVKKAVEMSGTVDEQKKKYDELYKRLINLSNITPTSFTDLADMAEQAGQAGIRGLYGVYRVVNTANKLVIGANADAKTVITDLSQVAMAFGWNLNTEEGVKNLERYASVLDLMAKTSSTDVPGIVSATKDAAVASQQLGISAGDTAAGLSVLITSGVEANAAGTVYTRFFTQLTKNHEKFAQAMSGFTRVVRDKNGQIIKSFEPYKNAQDVINQLNADPIQVMTDAMQALQDTPDDQKVEALNNFFQFSGQVGARAGAMATNINSLTDALTAARNEWENGTTLQRDYDAMLQTTQASLSVLKNNLQNVGTTIGSVLLPVVNRLAMYAIPIIDTLAATFEKLDPGMQLIIVAAPILLAALTPVFLMFTSLVHGISILGMGFVTVISSVTTFTGAIGGLAVKSLVTGKNIGFLTKLFPSLAQTMTRAAGSGGMLSGVLGDLFGGIIRFVTLNPIGIFAAGFTTILKVLSGFGLNVQKYFVNLAQGAYAWGDRLMATYGSGLLGGAARVISRVVGTVAGWIAKFFEAHSPPEEGPLKYIDQWGTTLMNTYLQGFLLADWDILSEVGGYIKQAFDIMGDLSNADMSSWFDQYQQMKEALAGLIEEFNKTSTISEDLLSKIGAGMGNLGTELQKLVRYWLEYKRLQEKIKALENQRKTVLKTYDEEIKKISKMNISAEEKARLIREAIAKRDKETDAIDEEKKKTEEESDAAKEKLDWQKEYVKALLEGVDALRQAKKAGSDSNMLEHDWNPGTQTPAGTEVQDTGEEQNAISKKLQAAKTTVQQLFNGLMGKAFADGMSPEELAKWQKEDPTGFADAKKLYDLGKIVFDTWEKIKAPLETVGQWLGIVKKSTDKTDQSCNIFIHTLQGWLDWAAKLFTGGKDLTEMFAAINPVLKNLTDSWAKLTGQSTQGMNIWKVLGDIFTWIFGVVSGLLVGAFNVLITAISWVIVIVTQIIGEFVNFIAFISLIGQAIAAFINGDPAKGFKLIGDALMELVDGIFKDALGIFATIGWAILDTLFSIFRNLGAVILKAFGQEDAANVWTKFFDGIQTSWRQLYTIMETLFNELKSWVVDHIFNADWWKGIDWGGIWKGLADGAKKAWDDNGAHLFDWTKDWGANIKKMWEGKPVVDLPDASETMKSFGVNGYNSGRSGAVGGTGFGGGYSTGAINIAPNLKNTIADLDKWWKDVGDWWGGLGDKINKKLAGLGDQIGKSLSGAWQRFTNWKNQKVVDWNNFWGGLGNKARTKMNDIGTKIKDSLTSAWKSFTNWASEKLNEWGNWFGSLPTLAWNRLNDVTNGLPAKIATSLSDAWQRFTTWASTSFTDWGNWFASLPTKVWTTLTDTVTGLPKRIGDAIANGWQKFLDWKDGALTTWGNWFLSLSGKAWDALVDTANGLGAKLSGALNNMISVVGTWFSNATNIANWKANFQTYIDKAAELFKNLGQTLYDAINRSDMSKVVSGALNVINKFWKAVEAFWGVLLTAIINNWSWSDIVNSVWSAAGFAQGAIVTQPTLAWVGEGGEAEAVIPLSKLPGIIQQTMAGQGMIAEGGGMGTQMVVNINHPVVRDEQDIDKMADAVKRKIEMALENKRRMRGG